MSDDELINKSWSTFAQKPQSPRSGRRRRYRARATKPSGASAKALGGTGSRQARRLVEPPDWRRSQPCSSYGLRKTRRGRALNVDPNRVQVSSRWRFCMRDGEVENSCAADARTDEFCSRESPEPFYGSPEEGWRLMRTFVTIRDPALRKLVLDIVLALAKRDSQIGPGAS